MSFAARQTRTPKAYDSDRGGEAAGAAPAGEAGLTDLLSGAAGCSPFLAQLISQEADWLAEALLDDPEPQFEALLAEARSEAKDVGALLRDVRRRVALLVALADLGGVWNLEEVTAALSRFADVAVERALVHAVEAEVRRKRLPGGPGADGMVVIGMGKLGAGELNYSSDIDLICLFDGARHGARDIAEVRSAFVRATRRLCTTLSELTGEGYVFRTDLRLRPNPAVTPVCLSMDAAERYYEGMGRTWERAAWIKARPCAGDLEAGAAFIERLRPFIWRKHLDFVAIQDAHDMRLRIREHKGLHETELEGRDVKLGSGGIREIEFFTQTRQIIAGGRDPSLRVRDTVEGLDRLVAAGWVPGDDAEALKRDYRSLRELEHRLQMISDAQTHRLPSSPDGFDRLAALMGQDTDELRQELRQRFERVAHLTEDFFAPARPSSGPAMTETQQEITSRWMSYPALRSPRAVRIFERLRPALMQRLGAARQPDQALAHLDAFLSRLPAGVQLFALFEANPQLIDLLVDIADSAPELARYLGDNAAVLDAVIGGTFFEPWPGAAALSADLKRRLSAIDDYEKQLDSARRWAKEWHFRVGVHHLRGLIDADEAGRSYADLAQAVVEAIWEPVVANLARAHGAPPGEGAAVLGMGSLGAARLTSGSDLDLIVIYDAPGEQMSDGRRPLPARTYYARLTKALVTALSAPTAEGRLYQVDMRLRPSGKQGPVAVSFDAFQSYQRTEAWTWEHLALTRARPVGGSAGVGARVEGFCRELLSRPPDADRVRGETAAMRDRLASANPALSPWEVKLGRGRLQDIELTSAAATLIAGAPTVDLREQLANLPDAAHREALVSALDLFWPIRIATRLLSAGPLDETTAGLPLVLRESGVDTAEDLRRRIGEVADRASAAIDAYLGLDT